jgi:CYTH domain-containing protein
MKNRETERKFLVTSTEWKRNSEGVLYRQGYLSTEPGRTVRVRLEGNRGKLTIKGKKESGSGDEYEYDIPGNDAAYIIDNLCLKPIIEKIRYKVDFKGYTWEVDEFLKENKGLVIAEIELESPFQEFEKPAWVGEDVTEDQRYKNANLVKKPFMEW